MPFDSKLQRQILGRFATGVTVVTTGKSPPFAGLTANAVSSLSLNPPLVLVCIDRRSQALEAVREAGAFAVNILAADQEALSQRFATPGPKRFDDLDCTSAVTGVPILPGTLGYVDCRLFEILPGGDHEIFLGEILAGELRDGEPLMYFAGKYARLAT